MKNPYNVSEWTWSWCFIAIVIEVVQAADVFTGDAQQVSDGLSPISLDSLVKRTFMWHAKNIENDMWEGGIKHWWSHTQVITLCDSRRAVGQTVRLVISAFNCPVIVLVMVTCI